MGTIENLTKWQNYAHYLLLTGGVFITHHLTDIWGLEKNVVNNEPLAWVWLFLFYALGLFIFDTAIHILFAMLPKPLKWED